MKARQRYNTVELFAFTEANKASIDTLVKGQSGIETQLRDLMAYVTSPASWTPEKQADAQADATVNVAAQRGVLKSQIKTAQATITRCGIAHDQTGMVRAMERHARLTADLSALAQAPKPRTTAEMGRAQADAAQRQRAIQAQSTADRETRTRSRVAWDSDVDATDLLPSNTDGIAYTWDREHSGRLHLVVDCGRMVSVVKAGKVVPGRYAMDAARGSWLNVFTTDGLHKVYMPLNSIRMMRADMPQAKGNGNPFVS